MGGKSSSSGGSVASNASRDFGLVEAMVSPPRQSNRMTEFILYNRAVIARSDSAEAIHRAAGLVVFG
jgi:hypothetical protein